MRKFLDRYYGTLRKIKANYVLLNVFNLKKLAHARRMYKKYGIQRSVLLPISSMDLPASPATELPWLDTPEGVAKLPTHPGLQPFDAATREAILTWPTNGYLVLRGLFEPNEVAEINSEIDRLIRDKVVDFNFTGRKIMFAFHYSELLRKYVHDRRILDVMDFVLGKKMQVFQSINFLTGSEQAAHSDSIHMTTHPLGYMTAAWIALEEITPGQWPPRLSPRQPQTALPPQRPIRPRRQPIRHRRRCLPPLRTSRGPLHHRWPVRTQGTPRPTRRRAASGTPTFYTAARR